MKKIAITAILLFALSSVGLASPLMNYDQGSVGFDYTYRPNVNFNGTASLSGSYSLQNSVSGSSDPAFNYSMSHSFSGKSDIDAGVTIGLGNNFAVQYRQYNPEGSIMNYSGDGLNVGLYGKIQSEEINVMYKVAPQVSAFVGDVRSSIGITPSGSYNDGTNQAGLSLPELRSQDKDEFQVGLLGVAPIGDHFSANGIVSYGSDYRNWQAGLSYAINNNLDFDVSYRDTKWENINLASGYIDAPSLGLSGNASVGINSIEAKGWGFGLTYKF